MFRWITVARSWHVLVRIGIATIVVATAAGLQLLPIGIEVPGEPFLLNFIAVVVSASVFGRTPGFFAAAESSIAAFLYFEPVLLSGLIGLTQAVDLAAIGAYAVMATLSVEAFCRFVDAALAQELEANLARTQRREALARLAAIVTSSTDAIVIETLDGTVTSWNGAAERIFGFAASEMIGRSTWHLTPVDRQQEKNLRLGRLARGKPTEGNETA